MSAALAPPLNVLLRERIVIDDAGLGNMWPVFYDTELFSRVIAEMAAPFAGRVDKIAGIEARGFLLGAAVAARLEVGFVAIRKSDGLYPGDTLSACTAADYRGRQHTFRLQRAALSAGERVGLVDDWFETGSQGLIARQLVEQAGASYVGASIIVDQLPEEKRRALAPCYALVDAGELNFPLTALSGDASAAATRALERSSRGGWLAADRRQAARSWSGHVPVRTRS